MKRKKILFILFVFALINITFISQLVIGSNRFVTSGTYYGRYEPNAYPNKYVPGEIYFFDDWGRSNSDYTQLGVLQDELWQNFMKNKYTQKQLGNPNLAYAGAIGSYMDDLWSYLNDNMWNYHESNGTKWNSVKPQYANVWYNFGLVHNWYETANYDEIATLEGLIYYNVPGVDEGGLLYWLRVLSSERPNDTRLQQLVTRLNEIYYADYSTTPINVFYWNDTERADYQLWKNLYSAFSTIHANFETITKQNPDVAYNNELIQNLLYAMDALSGYNNDEIVSYRTKLYYLLEGYKGHVTKEPLIGNRHISFYAGATGENGASDGARNSCDYREEYTYNSSSNGSNRGSKITAKFYVKVKDKNGNYKKNNTGEDIKIYCNYDETDELLYDFEIPSSLTVEVGDTVEFYDVSDTTGVLYNKINYDFQTPTVNFQENYINTFRTKGNLGQHKLIGKWKVQEFDRGSHLFFLQVDPAENNNYWTGYGSDNGNYGVAGGPSRVTECNWIYYFTTMKINVVSNKIVKEVFVGVDNIGTKTIIKQEEIANITDEYEHINTTTSLEHNNKKYIKIMRSYVVNGEYYTWMQGNTGSNYKIEKYCSQDELAKQVITPSLYPEDVVTIVYEYRLPSTTIHFKKIVTEHGEGYDETFSSPHCADYWWGEKLEPSYIYGYDVQNDAFSDYGFSVAQNGEGEAIYQPTAIWPSNGLIYNLVNSYLHYEGDVDSNNVPIKYHHININLNNDISKSNKNFSQDGGTREYITRNPGRLTADLNIVGEYMLNPDSTYNTITVKYVKSINDHTGYDPSTCLNENSSLIREQIVRVPKGENATINLDKTFTQDNKSYTLKASYIKNSISSPGRDHVGGENVTRNPGRVQNSEMIIIAECYEEENITTRDNYNVYYDSYTIKDMDSDARGVILDASADKKYNTYRGIPSDESIKGEIRADNFNFELEGTKVTGDATYKVTVPVTYTFSWGEYCPGANCICGGHTETTTSTSADGTTTTTTRTWRCGGNCPEGYCNGDHYKDITVTKNYVYDIKREFKYYTIDKFNIYQMKDGYLSNELFNNNLTWNGKNVTIDKWIQTDMSKHLDLNAGDIASGLTGQSSLYTDGFNHTTNTYTKSISLGNEKSNGWVYSAGEDGEIVTDDSRIDSNGYCKRSEYVNTAEGAIQPIKVRNDYLRVNIAGENSEVLVPSNGTSSYADEPRWQEKADKDVNRGIEVISEIEASKTQKINKTQKNNRYKTDSSITYGLKYSYSGGGSSSVDEYTSLTNLETFCLEGYKEINRNANHININNETTTANKVNDVAVHTPVYIKINSIVTTDSKNTDQKIDGNNDNTVVLDKKMEVIFTYTGTHRDIQGFGNNNYQEFMDETYIKFPFDVYIELNSSTTTFLKANTWYKLNSNMISNKKVTAIVPVWVDEKLYTNSSGIMMTVLATNDHGSSLNGVTFENTTTEHGGYQEGNNDRVENDLRSTVEANVEYLEGNYYSRTYGTFDVDVAGRVYDFKFTYTDDSNYKNEFLNGFDSKNISELPYPQAGDNVTNNYATALRLGSKIRFDLKTKGKLSSTVQVVPTFYWVSKDGGTMQKVDAYYKDANGKRVKLTTINGLTENINVQSITEIPNASDRTLLAEEIISTKQIGRTGSEYNYNSVTNIGKTGRVLLQSTERLTYNPLIYVEDYAENTYKQSSASVTNDAGGINNILRSNSHWYGEFTLPENTWFVAEGNSVNNAIDKKGYVIVYFNIVTKTSPDNSAYLSYQYPLHNTQWQKVEEGWTPSRVITLPNGKTTTDLPISTDYASIVIYDANVNKNGSSVIITH